MELQAMIVVDMQRALIEHLPSTKENLLENIKELMYICRSLQMPVLYIRHDGGIGDELEQHTDGWEISEEIYPQLGERVFDKKYNSAFKETGLHAYLQLHEITSFILCGMQSEYCLDTTCKVAFEYGYDVVIPKGTFTTFDQAGMSAEQINTFYADHIWHNRFANVVELRNLILSLQHDRGASLDQFTAIDL